MPRHVAFIMDGNGRWAKSQGKPRTEGHRQGVETVRTVLDCCYDWGIGYATLYAFSTENWRRPSQEVDTLFDLLAEYVDAELDRFIERRVRIDMLGDLAKLPDRPRKAMERALEKTRSFDQFHVMVALNYGGREEILRAIRRWDNDADAPAAAELSEERFTDYLDTREAPDPDLMIRTSGEQRISNFLLWQLAYSELLFVPEPWPAFDADAFRRALVDYAGRTRRFGRTDEQLEQP